jgi:hypothetical protein
MCFSMALNGSNLSGCAHLGLTQPEASSQWRKLQCLQQRYPAVQQQAQVEIFASMLS